MANPFPKWANLAPVKILICLTLIAGTVVAGVTYYATPKYLRVGYQPVQPVAFDHNLHVSQLGMDCRYCHTYVDRSEHSNVPAASTCMNCHNQVLANDAKLAPIRESYESGEPVPWVKIHNTPDYVYFNHSAHVNRGVSCVECHGQVNEMETVYHAKSLSMAFCLECHRNPENFIRPIDKVYDLTWKPENRQAQLEMGEKFVHDWNVTPPQSCSGCHR
ncbi:cytochrome c3 family protein [Rubellicoccus peritrichatus]|uniref:Cytochrome c3 family protein n=1 Tax=Rubellicoccus peritrichatus TaxID=3080537 RepID=A0AAQ3QTF2_9BACT|nr:cytochrome c3 family protein [Puniceicoccus sp. CR14]WOO43643.1 cytochrome c3 family protein [Puniceicoccus sp. CR14]